MIESTRRDFLRMAGLAVIAPLEAPMGLQHVGEPQAVLPLFVGTYTNGDSEGIYRCTFDTASGALEVQGVTGVIENPSYLAAHPSGRYLYAVSETSEFEGEDGGGVFAYAINPRTHALSHLNAQQSHGGAPCYVTVTPDGDYVLVANYSGGNVAILPIQQNGTLSPASDVERHEGSGPNQQRQQDPHAHCIVLGPSGRRAFAADLGIDRIVIYRKTGGELEPDGHASVAPGAGPRHFVFHPDGRRAYVINELDSTVTSFTYDDGALRPTQTIGTLPDDFEGDNYPADIHVSQDGRFLYGSNRGHDSIAVFAVDPDTGALSPVEHVKTGGRTPRNFALDPTDRFLLAANQDTDNIVVFARNVETGRLEETGQSLPIPAPVCLRFLPSS